MKFRFATPRFERLTRFQACSRRSTQEPVSDAAADVDAFMRSHFIEAQQLQQDQSAPRNFVPHGSDHYRGGLIHKLEDKTGHAGSDQYVWTSVCIDHVKECSMVGSLSQGSLFCQEA
jgi:hypothetical protein